MSAKFIILNTKFLVCDTQFLVFYTKFIILTVRLNRVERWVVKIRRLVCAVNTRRTNLRQKWNRFKIQNRPYDTNQSMMDFIYYKWWV